MTGDEVRQDPAPHTTRRARRYLIVLLVLNVVALVAVVLAYRAFAGGSREVRGNSALAALIASCFVFAFLLGLLLLPRRIRGERRRWWASWLFTGLSLVALVTSLAVASLDDGTRLVQGTAVGTDADVDAYLAGHMPPDHAPIRIPTGVFIQSIEFISGSNVIISGYVWQRFAPDVPKDITRGVVLPEAGDAYAPEEVYQRTDAAGNLVIGWYFEATLRQKFDYRAYPLDRQNVWLRMWQPDFDKDAVLVPDFESYPPWRGEEMLGLDEEIVTGEWVPLFSTYSHAQYRYKTSYGLAPYRGPVAYPDLYFNMTFERDYRGPALTKLVPAALIALIVFSSLYLMTRDERTMALSGFNSFAVVAFTVTMLVAVIVDHNSVRALSTDGSVLYLEYVYFAIYAVILLVTVNGILMSREPPPRLVRRDDNMLAKATFWPLVLGFLLVTTLTVFFT